MTYLLGNSSSLDMNYSRAFELFSENADLGFAPSQWTVAFHYATGLGVNASQARALVYLSFAALADVPEAQMALAFRYKQGLYVKQSCETALTYYRLVADHVAAGTRRPLPHLTPAHRRQHVGKHCDGAQASLRHGSQQFRRYGDTRPRLIRRSAALLLPQCRARRCQCPTDSGPG